MSQQQDEQYLCNTIVVDEDATIRDVAMDGYHLFFCRIRLNRDAVPPTARVHDVIVLRLSVSD
jgi:hypothetical protein